MEVRRFIITATSAAKQMEWLGGLPRNVGLRTRGLEGDQRTVGEEPRRLGLGHGLVGRVMAINASDD